MTLFFETGRQSSCFLAALPLGFFTTACLCWGGAGGFFRLAADLVLLACGGTAMVFLLGLSGEHTLRIYHILGLLTGAFLYLHGCNPLLKHILKHLREKRERAGRNRSKQKRNDIPAL